MIDLNAYEEGLVFYNSLNGLYYTTNGNGYSMDDPAADIVIGFVSDLSSGSLFYAEEIINALFETIIRLRDGVVIIDDGTDEQYIGRLAKHMMSIGLDNIWVAPIDDMTIEIDFTVSEIVSVADILRAEFR